MIYNSDLGDPSPTDTKKTKMVTLDLEGYRIGNHRLQPQEKEILALLLRNEGRVVKHEDIWNHLWGRIAPNGPKDPRGLIIVRMVYIRRKLQGTDYEIESLKGVGYRLNRRSIS
jgi:DNA-binding response OmpR family regulator